MDLSRNRRQPIVVEHVHSGRVDVHYHGDPRVDAIVSHLAVLDRRIEELMTAQDDVDAAVAGIGGDVTRMRDAIVRIQAEIAALQSQGVDTSGLVSALADLDGATGDLDNIAPATPPGDGGGDTNPPADGGGDTNPGAGETGGPNV